MIKLNFTISEFNISEQPIPEDIADKILKYHILPMQDVRNEFGRALIVSDKSGYRPVWWEKARDRSGNSQHCFHGKGAVDWTCRDFKKYKNKLLDLIIKHTGYTRIAVYGTFIHCDYKATDGKRYIFSSTKRSKWTLKETIE